MQLIVGFYFHIGCSAMWLVFIWKSNGGNGVSGRPGSIWQLTYTLKPMNRAPLAYNEVFNISPPFLYQQDMYRILCRHSNRFFISRCNHCVCVCVKIFRNNLYYLNSRLYYIILLIKLNFSTYIYNLCHWWSENSSGKLQVYEEHKIRKIVMTYIIYSRYKIDQC